MHEGGGYGVGRCKVGRGEGVLSRAEDVQGEAIMKGRGCLLIKKVGRVLRRWRRGGGYKRKEGNSTGGSGVGG